MIDYLCGRVAAAAPGRIVLEVGGVGLSIATPTQAKPGEPLVGREVTYYTRLVVREEELLLYGFTDPLERNLFNLVISVTGFGPRLALALLGTLTATQFYLAVLEENISLLCRAPGVGRKVAQRLVLELKEKLPQVMPATGLEAAAVTGSSASIQSDILEALCALGYSREEAAAAISSAMDLLPAGATREELLRAALKGIAGRDKQ